MMQKTVKMAKKDGLEQFQRQKAGSRTSQNSKWDFKCSKKFESTYFWLLHTTV